MIALHCGHPEEEFADTLRLDMAMFSPLALLRVADRLHVFHKCMHAFVDSEDDMGTLSIHPTCLDFAEEGELSRREAAKRLRRPELSRKKRPDPPRHRVSRHRNNSRFSSHCNLAPATRSA